MEHDDVQDAVPEKAVPSGFGSDNRRLLKEAAYTLGVSGTLCVAAPNVMKYLMCLPEDTPTQAMVVIGALGITNSATLARLARRNRET